MGTEAATPNLVPTQDELFESERQARIAFARRAAARKDILGWGEALFPEKFYLPFCFTLHSYFLSIRGESFTNTEAPRNHAKTLIKCFLIPLFQALNEPESFRHYLNVQATADKALEVNRAIKLEIEKNESVREIYGDQLTDRWTNHKFTIRNGVSFSAIGAGQSVRGINVRNVRPDYIIVDDLYGENDIFNTDSTKRKNNWFWGSLYPARAKTRRCSIHVQGTAINSDDLLEELKKRDGIKSAGFRSIEIWDDEATILWPELNDIASLKSDLARMGPLIFAREMQNERLDDSTTILKRSDWKLYKELPSGFDIIVTSWDMTFKETKSGSFVVGQIWGRRNADFYLFPTMVRGRMSFSDTVIAVQNLNTQIKSIYSFTASGHVVEDAANGAAVISTLTKTITGLVPLKPHGSKVARAAAITPALAAGNIHIPDESIAAWSPEFVEECAKFRGGDGEINDQVDAATQGVFYLMQTRYADDDGDDSGEEFVDGAEGAGGFSE